MRTVRPQASYGAGARSRDAGVSPERMTTRDWKHVPGSPHAPPPARDTKSSGSREPRRPVVCKVPSEALRLEGTAARIVLASPR